MPFPAILEAIVESGALIYPLYIPSGLIPETSVPKPEVTIDPLRTRYLTLTTRAHEEGQKLAQASGGVYYPIRHLQELQHAYDDVVIQLRTAYTVTYASNSRSSTGPAAARPHQPRGRVGAVEPSGERGNTLRAATQVICWDRGRPARKRADRRAIFQNQSFRASRSLRAGRPRSQQIA